VPPEGLLLAPLGAPAPSRANSQTLSPRVVFGKKEPAESATTYCWPLRSIVLTAA
jgi:hypothetical protein